MLESLGQNKIFLDAMRRGDPACTIQVGARIQKAVWDNGDTFPLGYKGVVTGNARTRDDEGNILEAYLVKYDNHLIEIVTSGGRIKEVSENSRRTTVSVHSSIDLTMTYTQMLPTTLPFKPEGLWYALDDEWKSWCAENGYPDFQTGYEFSLEIDSSNMLIIKDWIDYSVLYTRFVYAPFEDSIDWKKLTEEYAGIEIQNYHLMKRCLPMERSKFKIIALASFLTFSVSSGCIWDLSAIKKVTPIANTH